MRVFSVCLAAIAALLATGCETLRPSEPVTSAPAINPEDRRYATLVSEVGALRERLGQLELDLITARQEVAAARSEAEAARRGQPDAVSRPELNENIAQIRADAARQRRELLEQLNRSVDELAKRTNDALEQITRQVNAGASRGASSQGTQRTTTLPPLPADTPGQIYTVQAGDTLSGIARKFNVSLENIRRANQLTTDTIRVGQNLFIPDLR